MKAFNWLGNRYLFKFLTSIEPENLSEPTAFSKKRLYRIHNSATPKSAANSKKMVTARYRSSRGQECDAEIKRLY
jgi:hypothetical protein